MIDFHSHVLPGIDDGSASVDESLRMLTRTAEQGIGLICATPHFYPSSDDPESFLRHREHAWNKLVPLLEEGHPKVVLGAEVYYFSGISRNEQIADLRIGKTRLLLVEMPFEKWSDAMVREIAALNDRHGIQVVLAHIERYMRDQSRDVWDFLLDSNVVMQSNAEFFLDWRTKRKAARMVREGRVHIIGSDAHNMDKRAPKVGDAMKALSEEEANALRENSYEILRQNGGEEYLPGRD
jgi:protein-tyrosine phosphatase